MVIAGLRLLMGGLLFSFDDLHHQLVCYSRPTRSLSKATCYGISQQAHVPQLELGKVLC